MTRAGLERLKKDYENLKSFKLAKTSGETPHFLHSDEIDQEYLDFEDDLTMLESRIADLEYVLENAELIKPPPKEKSDTVCLGAKVLIDRDGHEDEYTILSSLEANPGLGIISDESPVGKALLGHKKGDQVVMNSPIKTIYKIKRVRYA